MKELNIQKKKLKEYKSNIFLFNLKMNTAFLFYLNYLLLIIKIFFRVFTNVYKKFYIVNFINKIITFNTLR